MKDVFLILLLVFLLGIFESLGDSLYRGLTKKRREREIQEFLDELAPFTITITYGEVKTPTAPKK